MPETGKIEKRLLQHNVFSDNCIKCSLTGSRMFGAEVAKQFGASLMAKIALLSFMPGRYSESRTIPGTAAKAYRNILQEKIYIVHTVWYKPR